MSKRIRTAEDIQPLTAFRNNSAQMLRQLRRSKRPLVLTVNGKAGAVLQDPAEYDRLLDLAAQADLHEAIRQSEDDIRLGRTLPASEFFAGLERKTKRAS